MRSIFRICFIFCLTILFFSFVTNYQNNNVIFWQSNRKLTWEDFQGKSDDKSTYKALTFSTVEVIPQSINDSTILYTVTCSFEKSLSWSKNKKSANLLRHEQLHFDIAELATRKLRKEISSIKYESTQKIKDQVKKMFLDEENERLLLNQKYDKETNHSIDTVKQKVWELKISKELKTFNKYSSTNIVLKKQ